MLKGMRALFAAGVVALAAVASFGYGYEGRFNGIAGSISEAVAEGNPSAVKIQRFIEKESDGMFDDFNTLSKVAKEAAKSGIIDEETLWMLFYDMAADGADELQDTFTQFASLAISHPELIKKNALYIAKSVKGLAKVNLILDEEDPALTKAAKAWAIYYKLAVVMRNIINKYST